MTVGQIIAAGLGLFILTINLFLTVDLRLPLWSFPLTIAMLGVASQTLHQLGFW